MRKIFLLLAVLCLYATCSHAQVAINQNGAPADASAVLDLQSTEKGLLIPRLSSLDRVAITMPATGLLIYNSSDNLFQYYNGVEWVDIGSGGANVGDCIIDTDEDTYVCVDSLSSDPDRIKFTIRDSVRWQMSDFTLESAEDMAGLLIGKGAGASFMPSFSARRDIVALGDSALAQVPYGGDNIAIGNYSLHKTTEVLNVAIGHGAMSNNTLGNRNTIVGNRSGDEIKDGANNVALGHLSLGLNGSDNVAIGEEALFAPGTGSNNVAVGRRAAHNNKTGMNNVGVGHLTLYHGMHRSSLVAIGDSSLYHNGLDSVQAVDGTWNTAVGSKTLFNNNIGFGNTAIGFEALYSNKWDSQTNCPLDDNDNCSISDQNTALGARSGFANTSGAANTFLGFKAGVSNTTGGENVFIGSEAGATNLTGGRNIAIGWRALYMDTNVEANNTIAVGNGALERAKYANGIVAIGDSTLSVNGSNPGSNLEPGFNNTAVGTKALQLNEAGRRNTALGFFTLKNNTTGSSNTALGVFNMVNNTTGDNNTAIGDNALVDNIDGDANVAVGQNSLLINQSGDNNVAVGQNTLANSISGNNNTVI